MREIELYSYIERRETDLERRESESEREKKEREKKERRARRDLQTEKSRPCYTLRTEPSSNPTHTAGHHPHTTRFSQYATAN